MREVTAAVHTVLFSGFIDVCPSGSIDRQSIAEIYAMPRRNAEKFIEQMFRMFDRDGDGKISFRVSSTFLLYYIYQFICKNMILKKKLSLKIKSLVFTLSSCSLKIDNKILY